MKKTAIVLALLACGCSGRENPPPPAPAAARSAVSTSAVINNPLDAAAAYVKTTVGQAGKAREAAALYEKAAADRVDPQLDGE